MRSILNTGANLLLKVQYPHSGDEKVIGFAKAFSYTVSQGQKTTYTVDSPFPIEIAQGSAASMVRGNLVIYLPKGNTLESVGLVPYRVNEGGTNIAATSRYLHFKIYDRSSNYLVFSCNYCKVSTYSINVIARGVVECNITFDGMYAMPGQTT